MWVPIESWKPSLLPRHHIQRRITGGTNASPKSCTRWVHSYAAPSENTSDASIEATPIRLPPPGIV
jgi:hypothetical protein